MDGKYEASYELYRFAFLNTVAAYGKPEEWSAEKRAEVFFLADTAARREISRVYAIFSMAEKHGIDTDSKEISTAVKAEVVDAIENESYGYGSQEKYLEALKASYMTDSVFRFYLRLSIVEEKLAKAMHAEKFVEEDDETVRAYFTGESTVCATWIYIPYASAAYKNFTDAMLEEMVARAHSASDEDFVKEAQQYLQTLYMPDELARGFYFGRYQMDAYYEKLTETAFSLEVGETSELIHSGDGVYIVRRLEKDADYIADEENIEELRECYLLDCFYRALSEETSRILDTLREEGAYADITLDGVVME